MMMYVCVHVCDDVCVCVMCAAKQCEDGRVAAEAKLAHTSVTVGKLEAHIQTLEKKLTDVRRDLDKGVCYIYVCV